MYEDITYEVIMKRLLSRVPNEFDKREGSVIYTAIAPAAAEIATMYIELETVLKETFAETAKGDFLDMRVAERGLERKAATYTIKKGIFNVPISVGARFSAFTGRGYVTYMVSEFFEQTTEGYAYKMVCETAGEIGNIYSGQLIPIDYTTGLTSAQLADLLSGGTDKETDSSLRERYFATFNVASFGGNISSYRNTILAIEGVGAMQIYPAWQGGGTVLCSILDGNHKPAGSDLIERVQNIVCRPEDGEATPSTNGYGLAPIGAAVTIGTADELKLNIFLTIQFLSSVTNGEITFKSQIEEKIEEYLTSVRQSWGSMIKSQKIEYAVTVYVSRIIYAILAIPEIVNVTNVSINGSAADVICVETSAVQQVPVLGRVTINGS